MAAGSHLPPIDSPPTCRRSRSASIGWRWSIRPAASSRQCGAFTAGKHINPQWTRRRAIALLHLRPRRDRECLSRWRSTAGSPARSPSSPPVSVASPAPVPRSRSRRGAAPPAFTVYDSGHYDIYLSDADEACRRGRRRNAPACCRAAAAGDRRAERGGRSARGPDLRSAAAGQLPDHGAVHAAAVARGSGATNSRRRHELASAPRSAAASRCSSATRSAITR